MKTNKRVAKLFLTVAIVATILIPLVLFAAYAFNRIFSGYTWSIGIMTHHGRPTLGIEARKVMPEKQKILDPSPSYLFKFKTIEPELPLLESEGVNKRLLGLKLHLGKMRHHGISFQKGFFIDSSGFREMYTPNIIMGPYLLAQQKRYALDREINRCMPEPAPTRALCYRPDTIMPDQYIDFLLFFHEACKTPIRISMEKYLANLSPDELERIAKRNSAGPIILFDVAKMIRKVQSLYVQNP